MPMDWGALRGKVEARYVAAHAAASVAVPGLVLIKGNSNRKRTAPSAEVKYLRAFFRRSATKRLADSDYSLERTFGFVVLEMLLIPETKETDAEAIFAAAAPSFRTAADGVEFEEAPHLFDGYLDGSHWLQAAHFPFTADALTSQ